MSGTARPPLPIERPRFPAGTAVGGRKVGGQFMSDSIVSAAREGMVSKDQLDAAQRTIEQQQRQINQTQKELQEQQQQIDQVQRVIQEQQPSRMQRLAGVASRTVAPLRALGPMGILRNINRAASTDRSMINFDLMDARRVADVTGFGAFGGARGGIVGGGVGPGAERFLFNISRDMSAARGSLSRIETTVNKIAGDSPTLGGAAPRAATEEAGGGGLAGLIGSMLGGLGGMFGRGGGGLGGAIRRLISTVARAIFSKIPIIGPLILVALNIEGAIEEYERNGLGAAITDLISGIGSDLTFGIVSKDSIKEFINNGIQRVTEWWNTAKETLQGVVDSVINNVKGFYDNVRTRFAETRDTLATRFEEARNSLVETFNNVRDTVEGAISSVLSGIRNFFSSMVNGYRDARNRLREASAEAEANRQRALEEMRPSPSGSPGAAAARGLAAGYNVSSDEYDAIERVLLTPAAGESDEERANRERLSEIQRRLGRSAVGNNVEINPEVAQYVASRREAEQLTTARESEAAALFGSPAENTVVAPQPQRVNTAEVAVNPVLRSQNPALFNSIQMLQQARNIQARRAFLENGTVVALEDIRGNRVDVSSITRGRTGGVGGDWEGTPQQPEMVTAVADTRTQTLAAANNQPNTIIVNNINGNAQAPNVGPSPASSTGTVATARPSRLPTHPLRPSDVGSPAMGGNALAY